MRSRRAVLWGSAFLVVGAGGVAALVLTHASSPVAKPASPREQLNRALDATSGSVSYVSTDSRAPGTVFIHDAPNVDETIDNGVIIEITVGDTTGYERVPAQCHVPPTYVEKSVQISSLETSLSGAQVRRRGDTFTVSTEGAIVDRYVVTYGRSVSRAKVVGLTDTEADGATVVYSRFNDAPTITVPTGDNVVMAGVVYNGCPV